jgi:Putative Ig domain
MVAVCLVVLGATSRAAAESITLEWYPTGDQVGYTVHVGVQSGSYTQHFDVGSGTLFTFASATAGQRYCFAVSAYLLSSRLEGPNSNEVCGYSNAPPTLVNPGDRTSAVGEAVTLQLQGSDPTSQPLTYSAMGLPPGLTLMASTGFISGAGSTAGTYSVTARVSDGTLTASQPFTWTMTSAPGDTTRPTVAIATPTTAATYSTTSSTITLTGSAGDNVGVTQVTWTNDRGGSGNASGTTGWAISSIPLVSGSNIITVTARDAAGNTGIDTLTVTYSGATTPAPTTVTLTAAPGSSWKMVLLTWTNASWSSVDVYRNNVKIKNQRNDGSTNDTVPRRGRYDYQVCAPGSTTVCSNVSSLDIQ